MTTDQIDIRDLKLRCVIGVYPEERTRPREMLVSVTVWRDLRQAGETDDLADTLDYAALAERITQVAEQSSDLLVERLAQRVAQLAIAEFQAERVRVQVEKPGAVPAARTVGVTIERTPADFAPRVPGRG